MNRFILVISLIFLFPGISCGKEVKFYGDILLSRGIENFVEVNGELPVKESISRFFTGDELRIANVEGAVGNSSQCAKGHNPCFSIKTDLLNLLAGFDVISLENNHSLDLGLHGLRASIREITKHNVIPLGGDNFSIIIETDDGNIGIVALTDVVNYVHDRDYVAMADSAAGIAEITRLKDIAAIVAVYIHWGREFDNVPTERMKELAKRFVRAGADIVVGTHPHVVGKVDCIEGKPVVYSLGNFLFDQKYEDTKRGAVLQCDIKSQNRLTCTLIGHRTPFNSYLPHIEETDSYKKENELLARCTPEVQKTWVGIFSQDKKPKRLILRKDKNKQTFSHLEMYDLNTGKKELESPSMPVVKLQPIDVNGDGLQEIMLIQNIYSSLDDEVAKRVYIYSLDKNFHALWRGSALSRPLLDAVFITFKNKEPRLIALHTADSFLLRKKNAVERIVMSYRWNGFGFVGLKEMKLNIACDRLSFLSKKLRLVDDKIVVSEISVEDFR